MISYNATALFPSIPIQEAINHIKLLLENDPELASRTKLSPSEIAELISLCVSTSNFIYNGRHHTQKDSGPIGLSIMVTISQIWMTFHLDEAIEIANARSIPVPRHITIYMDDCWGLVCYPREGLRNNSPSAGDPAVLFNQCLNEVHERVQFTREEEKENSIPFLDVSLTREAYGKLTTTVYRKPSNTNITIKPSSCQQPSTSIATFKAELCRAHRICSTPELLKNEINFIINLFEDNGHERTELEEIASTYQPPPLKKRSKNKKRQSKNNQSETNSDMPENLFDILPFRDCDLTDDTEKKPYARIPYMPGPVFHQIKRTLKKYGITTCATSGRKLGSVLCAKNKTRPPPTHFKGIYLLKCTCDDQAVYVGQTIRSICQRCQEHKKAAEKENWAHSGISQHKQTCKAPVDWENPTVLATMSGKNKGRLAYDLKVQEALEIRRHNCGPGSGLNEDMGAYVKTSQWDPVFRKMAVT